LLAFVKSRHVGNQPWSGVIKQRQKWINGYPAKSS
jgi:hypothetical protein